MAPRGGLAATTELPGGRAERSTMPTEPDIWEDPPDWPPNDPRWHAHLLGWQAGYAAAKQDLAELRPELLDELLAARFALLLRHLSECDHAAAKPV